MPHVLMTYNLRMLHLNLTCLQGGYSNGGYGYRPSYNGGGYAGAGMGPGGVYHGGRGGPNGSQMSNQANPLWAAQGYPVTGPGGSVTPSSCGCSVLKHTNECHESSKPFVFGKLHMSLGQHAFTI